MTNNSTTALSRKFVTIVCQIVFMAFILLPLRAAIAESIQVPGSIISMEAPSGFSLSEDFSGFMDPETSSSIVVVELPPEAYAEVSTIFGSEQTAAEALSAQGIEVDSIKSITINGQATNLVIGEQMANGISVGKYIVILSGEKTVMVTVNVVDENKLPETEIIAALESIALSAPASLDEQLAQLNFSVDASAPFKPLQVVAGASLVMSVDDLHDPSREKPVIAVARSLQSIDSSDIQALSESILMQTPNFEAADVGDGIEVETSAGQAYRVEAQSNNLLAIQYLWELPDGTYIRMIAQGAREQLEPLQESVTRTAASLKLR